jgi:hypothetical protein
MFKNLNARENEEVCFPGVNLLFLMTAYWSTHNQCGENMMFFTPVFIFFHLWPCLSVSGGRLYNSKGLSREIDLDNVDKN